MTRRHRLWRACVAEFLGTGMLTLAVVGSGIAATSLSADAGVQLAINAAATGLALYVIITVFAPVSGAHLNTVVSLVDAVFGGRPWRHLAGYLPAQFVGGILGVVLANTIFGRSPVSISTADRYSSAHLAAEIVATAGLVLVIFTLSRGAAHKNVSVAVAAYIAAAYFFTSSTSFANPAVTIGRIFTDSFAGISPISALAFLPAQVVGALIGIAATVLLSPSRQVASTSRADQTLEDERAV
ncbi:aquaporin family protein [Planctomonas sp. JC2975]|uniref:aquaporin n=1 Tax=Planctomonas sp. JC2975 TaxID=2729626 RepID=UPI001476378B|nr:aquaporin [Planctomonas sp. JC2975]NNC13991.1 aquaporin family protein [Planctomonas sp. JC2975]